MEFRLLTVTSGYLRVASRFEVQFGMELATSTTTATCCTLVRHSRNDCKVSKSNSAAKLRRHVRQLNSSKYSLKWL